MAQASASRSKFRFRTSHWRRWLLALTPWPFIWLTIHVTVVYWVGFHDDLRPADVAVVLGNLAKPDGTPDKVLQARLDRTVTLYRQGLFTTVIVSGATWQDHYDEPACMQRYLIKQGVDANAILLDRDGKNTRATAIQTAHLMKARHWHNVLVISDAHHLLRCRQAFSDAGIDDIRTAHAAWKLDYSTLRGTLRETLGFYRYLFHRYPSPSVGEPAGLPPSDEQ